MDWDDIKAILGSIVIIGLMIGFIILFVSCEEHVQEDEFRKEILQYSIIIINGEEYKVKEIEQIKVECAPYRNDVYTIYLEDGTKISFMEGGYTLKEKK